MSHRRRSCADAAGPGRTRPAVPPAAQSGPVSFRQGDRERPHRQLAARIGRERARRGQPDGPGGPDGSAARTESATRAVRAAIGALWPVLTPQQLVSELLSDPDRLARGRAAACRTPTGPRCTRAPDAPWTPADVPLLDEAAELLGEDDRAARASGRRRRQEEALRAGRARHHRPGRRGRPEVLMGADLVDASRLAARYEDEREPDRGRAGGGRPDLGLRARHRGRGAGTVAAGLADADAALPGQVADDRRRRRADRRPGRPAQLGRGARSLSRGPVAAGAADRQLPGAGRSHGGSRRRAGRDRPGAATPRSVRESGHEPWQLQAAPGELAATVAQAG